MNRFVVAGYKRRVEEAKKPLPSCVDDESCPRFKVKYIIHHPSKATKLSNAPTAIPPGIVPR
ncbi:MAG: hypothetical protein AAEJ46_10755 [Planctomycetota bacterium]|jgi:hypothetical protein